MPRLWIVGFPNSGKTTLFNALTSQRAITAVHPYSTTEPNVGMAKVPDPRLDRIAEIEGSEKVTPAILDVVDLPAVASDQLSWRGEDLGRLREMDAIVAVLRGFSDPAVADAGSGIDPLAQAEEIMLELAVSDHQVFSRRAERLAKEAAADRNKGREAQAIAEATELLAQGEPLRSRDWDGEAERAFRDLGPLTKKPTMWVVNVDEDFAGRQSLTSDLEKLVPDTDQVVVLSAKIEEEGAQLSPLERAELFGALGLGDGALGAMVRATYAALGLQSFYTIGPKESRAWTVRVGAPASEAAGKIHSDLERGFIRAEVANLDAVIQAGGWTEAKRAGLVRVEGKSYAVADADVLHVRFSV